MPWPAKLCNAAPQHQAAKLLCRYWQCQPGAPEPASPPAGPNSTIVVTLVFQFPVGSAVQCSGIDLAAAERAVLQRVQTLSASTGRSYSGAGATCSEVPVPSGAGRRLLGATQTVLEVSAASAGPAEGVDPLTVAVSVQSSVASELTQVLDEAVQVPGYNAAADVQNMSVQLQQVVVDGQELLRSPPPPAEVAAGGWDAPLPSFHHAALHQ